MIGSTLFFPPLIQRFIYGPVYDSLQLFPVQAFRVDHEGEGCVLEVGGGSGGGAGVIATVENIVNRAVENVGKFLQGFDIRFCTANLVMTNGLLRQIYQLCQLSLR